MRIAANENIAGSVIRGLRDRGHDVLSVKESMRGASDEAILARAQSEKRVVITHDKDFGELAFRSGLPAESGVILFRLSGTDRESDNRRILEAVDSRPDWEGYFGVVEQDRIRIRRLPITSASEPEPGD